MREDRMPIRTTQMEMVEISETIFLQTGIFVFSILISVIENNCIHWLVTGYVFDIHVSYTLHNMFRNNKFTGKFECYGNYSESWYLELSCI